MRKTFLSKKYRESLLTLTGRLSSFLHNSASSLWTCQLSSQKNGKEGITHGQLFEEIEAIGKRIEAWKTQMDPSLQDSRYLVTDFSGAPAFDPDDIVNPYMPGVIYGGPLWVMNVAAIDWHSISLMHLYQTALTIKTQPSRELCLKAYASCQLFESV